MKRLRTIKDRLENYSIPEPNSGCWLWTGTTNGKTGYGLMSTGVKGQFYAHRVSYEFYCGPIPAGVQILHKCDNSCCINPDHLYPGTVQDNMRDVRARRRGKGKHDHQGEKHPCVVLTEDDVLAIRASKDTGIRLAAQYGVCKATISHIKTRRNWSHI